MIRYLLISTLIVAVSCRTSVPSASSTEKNCASTLMKLDSIRGWYSAKIDVYEKHLSGLLLIKNMPDGSVRLVFTNEAGISFFDLEFDAHGKFSVKKIIRQLDRGPVINTLKTDFALLLGIPFRKDTPLVSVREGELYHGVRQKKDEAYFITDMECASLQRLGIAADTKEKVTITPGGEQNLFDNLIIKHKLFDMAIALTKIKSN